MQAESRATETCQSAPLLEAAAEVKFCKLDLKDVSLDGTFEGYASLFDREDLGRDVVRPGAFRDSISERGAAGIKMLFQHDAAEPIGVWQRIHEDARGLFARGRLMTDVARAREVLALMRAGAVDGLSIGFRAVRSQRDRRTGIRYLNRIDLWEISVVTFPMQPDARITGVKSSPFAGRVPSEREFERWLTQDAGFSRSQARSVIRSGLKGLSSSRDADGDHAGVSSLKCQIEEAAKLLRSAQSCKPNFEVVKW